LKKESGMNENRFRRGFKVSFIALVLTLILAITKGLIGYYSDSLLLISDAFHSASDLMIISMAIIGIKISSRKADEKFPYGYYKAENISTLFISLFIIFAGYEIAVEGYRRIFQFHIIRMPFIAMATAFFSVLISYYLSIMLDREGKREGMQSLIAVGRERKMDSLSSVGVFAGIILGYYHIRYVEGIFSIMIALLILKTGVENAINAVYALMDFSPQKEKEKVEKILMEFEEIEGFDNLKLRKSGPFLFGEGTIFVRGGYEVKKAHSIADSLEEKIKREIPIMDSFTLHIEPPKKRMVKVAIPVEKGNISPHFGRAEEFRIYEVDMEEKQIKKEWKMKNPYVRKKVRAGLALGKKLLSEDIDVLITEEIGEISFYTLKNEGVEIYYSSISSPEKAIEDFMEGKLEVAKEPSKERV